MASPFKQKTQSFFSANNTNMFGLNDFAEKTNKIVSNLPKFNYRGKDAYNEVVNSGVQAPYVKSEGTDKKFPYLSSKHHIGNVYNPMESSIRNKNAMTIAEQNKLAQDTRLRGSFVEEGQGTRGSSHFGDSFKKLSEKDAKSAVQRHEYLKNAASQGEVALEAALSTAEVANKNNVMIDGVMPAVANFPFRDNSAGTKGKNLDDTYAANPRGRSAENINSYLSMHDRAVDSQNTADTNRRNFNDVMNKAKNIQPTVFSNFDPRFIASTGFDPKSGM
jgi:hypothetical protein|tara:strand:- start:434 stop:1261 length:828 start_codon:yes stop_codon:yes gene_type:complete